MPFLRALDNNLNPTNNKQFFSEEQANKILKFTRCCWELTEPDKPVSHRDRDPVVEHNGSVVDFNPQAVKNKDIKSIVDAIDDIDILEKGLHKELNSSVPRKGILSAIENRINELKQK